MREGGGGGGGERERKKLYCNGWIHVKELKKKNPLDEVSCSRAYGINY